MSLDTKVYFGRYFRHYAWWNACYVMQMMQCKKKVRYMKVLKFPDKIVVWQDYTPICHKNTSTNFLHIDLKTLFTNEWNIEWEFVSPKGITFVVLLFWKVVLWMSSSFTLTLWPPDFWSNFEKCNVPCNSSNNSLITDIGNWSNIVTLFNVQ